MASIEITSENFIQLLQENPILPNDIKAYATDTFYRQGIMQWCACQIIKRHLEEKQAKEEENGSNDEALPPSPPSPLGDLPIVNPVENVEILTQIVPQTPGEDANKQETVPASNNNNNNNKKTATLSSAINKDKKKKRKRKDIIKPWNFYLRRTNISYKKITYWKYKDDQKL